MILIYMLAVLIALIAMGSALLLIGGLLSLALVGLEKGLTAVKSRVKL